MELQSIVCPNCGATTTKKDYCEFCGSFLVGKISSGINVDRYADTVRKMPLNKGIKQMLDIFTNIVYDLDDQYCKLLVLDVINIKAKGIYDDGIILSITASHNGIILKYPGNASYEFANSSMFTLFEKKANDLYIVSFGKDIGGAVKFINQFNKELYPKADISFRISILSPDNKGEMGHIRYNRDGNFIDGYYMTEAFGIKNELSVLEINSKSIEELIKIKENIINTPKELEQKLKARLYDKKFVSQVNDFYFNIENINSHTAGDSILMWFSYQVSSIDIRLKYIGIHLIKFSFLNHISPDIVTKPYFEYGDCFVEAVYTLKASDLKRISESQDKEEFKLYFVDNRGHTKCMNCEQLRKIISVIWQAVEDPVEGMSKLQTVYTETNRYQRNLKKHVSWAIWTLIIWGVGSLLTLIIGGIWSFVVENKEPIIWFAIVTIVLGALCIFKVFGLKSDIKAYESKYGRAFYIH